MSNRSTPVVRSFVLICTDSHYLVGRFTCGSSSALSLWLQSQNEMLTDNSVSWLRPARLAWSGCSVLVAANASSTYLLAPAASVSYYRQDGSRLVQFEPSTFSFWDFMQNRVSEARS